MIKLVGPYALGVNDAGAPVPFTHLWRTDVLNQTLAVTGDHLKDMPLRTFHYPLRTLVNIWSNNIFHFVTEALAALVDTDKTYVLVHHSSPRFIFQGLDAIGFASMCKTWDGVATNFTNLMPHRQTRHEGHTDPESLAKLSKALNPSNVVGASKYIYISRNDAIVRRVLNDRLIPAMFNHVALTGIDFMHQVNLFRSARVIIAPHGAGLTHMIWAPKGCHIIELFGEYHNDCYEKLAADLQHKYTKIQCGVVGHDMVIPEGVL